MNNQLKQAKTRASSPESELTPKIEVRTSASEQFTVGYKIGQAVKKAQESTIALAHTADEAGYVCEMVNGVEPQTCEARI